MTGYSKTQDDYSAGMAAGETAAETFADVMTHTQTAPAGSSQTFRAGWRVGFSKVRNRLYREMGDS